MSRETYKQGLEGIEIWDPWRLIGIEHFSDDDLKDNEEGLKDRDRIEAEQKARDDQR